MKDEDREHAKGNASNWYWRPIWRQLPPGTLYVVGHVITSWSEDGIGSLLKPNWLITICVLFVYVCLLIADLSQDSIKKYIDHHIGTWHEIRDDKVRHKRAVAAIKNQMVLDKERKKIKNTKTRKSR
jgi:hypothetical protein